MIVINPRPGDEPSPVGHSRLAASRLTSRWPHWQSWGLVTALTLSMPIAAGAILHRYGNSSGPTVASIVHVSKVNGLPNAVDTPGAVDDQVEQGNISTTICVPGYARSVRPSYALTGPLKRAAMRRSRPHERFSEYELDHLIPLSLGGAPLSAANLWLEPRYGEWSAQRKEALEFVLWKLVCTNEAKLDEAQQAIGTDWIAAYKKYATARNLERFHYRGEESD